MKKLLEALGTCLLVAVGLHVAADLVAPVMAPLVGLIAVAVVLLWFARQHGGGGPHW